MSHFADHPVMKMRETSTEQAGAGAKSWCCTPKCCQTEPVRQDKQWAIYFLQLKTNLGQTKTELHSDSLTNVKQIATWGKNCASLTPVYLYLALCRHYGSQEISREHKATFPFPRKIQMLALPLTPGFPHAAKRWSRQICMEDATFFGIRNSESVANIIIKYLSN